MSLFAKIMVIVNFILAVAFLAAAGTLLGASESWKLKLETQQKLWDGEKTSLQAQVAEFQGTNKTLDQQRNTAVTGQQVSDSQLKTLSDINDGLAKAGSELRASYDKLSTAQQDLQAKISEANTSIEKLRGELTVSETGRREATDKIKALTDENARLGQDKDAAEKNQDAAEAAANAAREKLDEVATTLERYKKEYPPIQGGVTMVPVRAVVQAADAKVDVYVVSVGSKDQVKVGYEFTVFRGSEYVARIVIDKVWKDYASGRTIPGTKRKDIQAGDECSTQL
jgi:septal ring factor EnvC (AmiA/AmiB activator)